MADNYTGSSDYKAGRADEANPSVIWYYMGILRRRIWVILPVVVILTTLGTIKAFRTPRQYKAVCKLLIEKESPRVMRFEQGLNEASSWDNEFYKTQTELIGSRSVLEIAAAKPSVRRVYEKQEKESSKASSFLREIKATLVAILGATPAPPPDLWKRLSKDVEADVVTDSHFVEIIVVFEKPYEAALLANATGEGFLEYSRERRKEMLGAAFLALQNEKEKEEEQLLQSERELQAFRERASTVAIESEKNQPAIERLNRLNTQLTDVQLARIQISAQIGVMKDSLEAGNLIGRSAEERLFAMPVIQDDKALSEARKELANAEKTVSSLAVTYGAQHPQMVAARSKLDVIKQQFRAGLNEILQSHINRFKMLQAQENDLKNEYDAQKSEAINLAKETFDYTRLMNSVQRHRQLFDSLVARMSEVDVSSGLTQTNVQIVEEASAPDKPSTPGKSSTITLAALIGLFLGCGLAFLIENLDDTVKTPEDLRERLDLPLLGFVPSIEFAGNAEGEVSTVKNDDGSEQARSFRDIKPTWRERVHSVLREFIPSMETPREPEDPAKRAYAGRILLREPMSSVAEAYRSIRASLFYATPAEEIKLLAITSCRPQEGKTTTSANLALCIAQTGKKVLLVDGDLHRPSVHKALGIENGDGLTSVLVGEKTWEEALVRADQEDGQPVECLHILTAGPSSPSPSELLNSERMKQLLATVRDVYDWVIVDTPPVLFVSDSRILSVLCDGVIMIVKSGTSTRSLLMRAREQLDIVQARMIGSILNNVQVTRVGRHYSSYYSYGYSRYSKDYKNYYYQNDERSDAKSTKSTSTKKTKGKDKDGDKQAQAGASSSRPMTPLEQAALHVDAGNPGRARTLLEEHLDAKPDQFDAWEMLFEISFHQKDLDALLRNLERYSTARGQQGYVYALGKGYEALLRGELEQARDAFDEALAIKPDNARSLEGVLRVDLQQGRTDLAESRASELMRLDPQNAYGYYVSGTLHVVNGRHAEAVQALTKSVEMKKTPEAFTDLAWLLWATGKLAEAEQMARAALELDSRMVQVWDALGVILMSAERLDESRKAFDRALTLAPDDINTLMRMCELLVKTGNRADALPLLKKLADRKQDLSSADLTSLEKIEKALA